MYNSIFTPTLPGLIPSSCRMSLTPSTSFSTLIRLPLASNTEVKYMSFILNKQFVTYCMFKKSFLIPLFKTRLSWTHYLVFPDLRQSIRTLHPLSGQQTHLVYFKLASCNVFITCSCNHIHIS